MVSRLSSKITLTGKVHILSGDPGTGKTFFCLWMAKRYQEQGLKVLYLDLENRCDLVLLAHSDVFAGFDASCIKTVIQYGADLMDNYVGTWRKYTELVNGIIQSKPDLIVVDGITDLRRMATEFWVASKSGRSAAATIGDWGEVNQITKKSVFPIINYCRIGGKKALFTALLSEVYEGREATGKKELNVKDYIVARSDEIWRFTREGVKFLATRGKSPAGPSRTTVITKFWEDEQ